MTKKRITIATLGGITLFALGITSGIWLATPDIISGAPQDENGNVPSWAWELCECTKNGITYLMPDVWSRGAEDDTSDGETLLAHALEPEDQQAQAGLILSLDTQAPRAHVKTVVVSSTDPDDLQEVEVKADDEGKARVQFERDVSIAYEITLTVNGQPFTMTDTQSTCEGLEIIGVKGFTTPQGVQCMTLDIILKDVPLTPVEEEPKEDTPSIDDGEDVDKEDTIDGDVEVPKLTQRVSAPMQKPKPIHNDNVESTPISQGMPTAVAPANPVAWLFHWFLSLWV